MKKILIYAIALIVVVFGAWFFIPKFLANPETGISSNLTAEKNKNKEKFITIVNGTGEVWNEVSITDKKETDILKKENIKFKNKSFTVKIPKEFAGEEQYIVKIKDRYNYEYTKKLTYKEEIGRKSIKITDKDCSKDGSLFDKIVKKMNE
ncbi:hypothetical protein [Streptococcus uberis]|uniref:hypothetical protein n=1 Tax=Streptococcus uberis TaxID=1349 RepID=UPI0019398DA2|nr:hypothetical protein [Streptococcus uberis]